MRRGGRWSGWRDEARTLRNHEARARVAAAYLARRALACGAQGRGPAAGTGRHAAAQINPPEPQRYARRSGLTRSAARRERRGPTGARAEVGARPGRLGRLAVAALVRDAAADVDEPRLARRRTALALLGTAGREAPAAAARHADRLRVRVALLAALADAVPAYRAERGGGGRRRAALTQVRAGPRRLRHRAVAATVRATGIDLSGF